MPISTSQTAEYLRKAIEASSKTQREIAEQAGFRHPNVLSMMKSGETKVPIARIPDLADALRVPHVPFLLTAIEEYHPEVHEVLFEYFGAGLSRSELILLEVFDEARHAAPFELDAGLCNVLLELFAFVGHMHKEFGA